MAEAATQDSPSAEDLIDRAKSLGGGQYVPSPDMAGKMAEDLKEISSREKGDKTQVGGKAAAPDTGQAAPAKPDNRPQILSEAYRRGLLPPDQKALYEEAQRRGIVKGGSFTGKPPVEYQLSPGIVSLREAIHGQVGPLPDVDYTTGTDWMDKVYLDQADDDREKYLYLEKKYGADKIGRDPNGIFYVTVGGKKVAPGGGGFVSRFTADVTAEAPIFGGASMGAAAGVEGGIPGMAAGAAIGGASGKLAIEGKKRLEGISAKDIVDTLNTSARTGLEMGAGEAGAGVLSRTVGRATAGRVPSILSGTTPETRRLTAITTEGGAAPPTRSALPDMRTLQWHQALGTKLTGDLLAKKNLSYIESEMAGLLKNAGMPEADIPAAMQEILNPSAALSTGPLGMQLSENIQAYAAGLGEEALAAKDAAKGILDSQLSNIRLLTRERVGPGRLGADVVEKFREARGDFSRGMQRVYSKIDDLVGDRPIVPTFLAKRKAASLVAKMPESDIRKIIQEIAEMKPLESFENMQRLRTRLWELGEPKDLAAAGVLKKDLRDLRTMVDRSFDQVNLGTQEGPTLMVATRMLRSADKAYRDGIQKFEDGVLNQIVDAMEGGTAPDPGVVSRMLLQAGKTERISEFRRLLGPDIWKRVVAQDWRDMLEVASEKGEIDPMRFFKEVIKRERTGVLEAAYGTNTAAAIGQFARRQAVLGGKLPVSALDAGDGFERAVFAASQSQKALDTFVDEHFLGELANPTLAPELVYSSIVQPGKETLLNRVFEHFTVDSLQVQGIRQTAMKVLLKDAIVKTETGAGITVGADALQKALSRFTQRQQELLFPDGLADDLNLLADKAKFLFPRDGGDMSAGLAAGAIKGAMPFGFVHGAIGVGGKAAWVAYSYGAVWNYILSRPKVVRWLANGISSRDTAVRAATDETFRGIVRAGMLGMLPGQEPGNDE